MIDVDHATRLRKARVLAFLAAVSCTGAFIAALTGYPTAAYAVLAIGAITFAFQFLFCSIDLHQMRLVDDDDLHKRHRDN